MPANKNGAIAAAPSQNLCFLRRYSIASNLCCARIYLDTFCALRAFQLRQNLAQRHDQLIPRNVALLELNAELKRFILRFEVENERLRPVHTALLVLPFFP